MEADHPVKILLVDDRPKNLVALEALLEDLGQTLVKANSGRQALKQLLDHDVAVVLLDVQMPGLDGFQTAEMIRQRDRTKHTPIIFVTGISKDHDQVLRGYSLGAVDYIFKPIDPVILRSKVMVFVELFRSREEIKRQAELLLEAERERERERQKQRELRRQEEEQEKQIRELEAALSHYRALAGTGNRGADDGRAGDPGSISERVPDMMAGFEKR